jgi:hypothetical protein
LGRISLSAEGEPLGQQIMSETQLNDASARRFLLGDIDESERQRIERLVILDPEVKQTLVFAEEDLIEAFLDGDLSSAEREKFLVRYGTSPQRNQWQIAEALRRRAVTRSMPQPTPAANAHWYDPLVSSLRLRNRSLLIPATAVLLVLAVVAIWLSYRQIQSLQEANRVNAIERQLSHLNSPSELGADPPQMLAVTLSPVSTRSGGRVEFDTGSTYKTVELRLLWLHDTNYQNYDAIIQRVSRAEKYKIHNLRLQQTERGNVIRLRAPAGLFDRGMYQIILSSVSKDGTSGPIEEYTFDLIR